MPNSEFDLVELVGPDRRVRVTGKINWDAGEVPEPLFVMWMVEQGGSVAAGVAGPTDDLWQDTESDPVGVWGAADVTASGALLAKRRETLTKEAPFRDNAAHAWAEVVEPQFAQQ